MPDPANPRFVAAVRANFDRQAVMKFLGARLARIEPGRVAIELPVRPAFAQQRGYVHAGILATIVDSAGGYAAYTLAPKDTDVLTVEFKMNFLAPAQGEKVVATADVVRAGRRLTVCELRVESAKGRQRTLCVTGSQTIYTLLPRRD